MSDRLKMFWRLVISKKKRKKNSQLLNSAFRTITRRSTRSKYFLLTDNHRRTRTDHINNRELNKSVYKEFSFTFLENIINNSFIVFRSLLLSRKIFWRPIRWLLYMILFTFYNIIDKKKKYELYIYNIFRLLQYAIIRFYINHCFIDIITLSILY